MNNGQLLTPISIRLTSVLNLHLFFITCKSQLTQVGKFQKMPHPVQEELTPRPERGHTQFDVPPSLRASANVFLFASNPLLILQLTAVISVAVRGFLSDEVLLSVGQPSAEEFRQIQNLLLSSSTLIHMSTLFSMGILLQPRVDVIAMVQRASPFLKSAASRRHTRGYHIP